MEREAKLTDAQVAERKKKNKANWNVGWHFNMGRTCNNEAFSVRLDGTSAFEFAHPFFKSYGVYLADPMASKSNPYWKKEIFFQASQVLKLIDKDYMRDGDWCLYVSCMLADECAVGRHSDRHDVSHQYNIFLGNYENAVYEVESPDGKEIREFTSTRKVLKVDARCRHRVNTVGFKGVRYCVTMYKMYDRTQKEPDPVFWPPVWI